jgi:hypothetical protein
MPLLYAATFTDALGRLTGQEQKQVKLAAFDLQMDPRGNGLQMHRVEKTEGFWTARVSQDIRMVLHKSGDTTLLAYVDHHDAAYRWAERKRLVPHERTGAMQFVEIPLVMAAVPAPVAGALTPVSPEKPAPPAYPFAALSDDAMLDVGVPRDWLDAVRATTTDSLFAALDLLPAEAAEALMDFATGGRLEDHVAVQAPVDADPYGHPDAQRRFRTVDNLAELQAALDQPFARWAVFLHPAQRNLVTRHWSGPARVGGTAGTGKTIVALHRAVHLARANGAGAGAGGVLLTTFSKPLAAALAAKCDILTEAEPALRARVIVAALDQASHSLYATRFGQPAMATPAQVRAAIAAACATGLGAGLAAPFLFEEWDELVDAWNVSDADAYAAIPRVGRRTRLGPRQREAAWGVFAFVRQKLRDRGVLTWAQLYARLTDGLLAGNALPYVQVVVDEAQDLSVAQARFLSAAGRGRPDALFFAGDQGQRIFHLPFSWAKLGLDVRGRSHSLKVNYRTSHQIRAAADRLLPAMIADMDGIEEGRRGTVSVFDGPVPTILIATDAARERDAAASFLRQCLTDGMAVAELGLLVRGEGQLARARAAAAAAGIDVAGGITITTMHHAKGLEFRAVVVMACDEDILPDPARLAAIGDVADMEAAYETERHLLYVACTRARDRLLVSGVAPGSEFLDDMRAS